VQKTTKTAQKLHLHTNYICGLMNHCRNWKPSCFYKLILKMSAELQILLVKATGPSLEVFTPCALV